MNFKRRQFLIFMGSIAGSMACSSIAKPSQETIVANGSPNVVNGLKFKPVKVPLPLTFEPLNADQQIEAYQSYEVLDDLVLPEGYTYDLIAAWGDKVGDSRFGYNNDYVSFIQTAEDEGLLTVNFEYISPNTWLETYAKVIGRELPLDALVAAFQNEGTIDHQTLAENDVLRSQIETIAQEALIDVGIGVLSVERDEAGRWIRTYGDADRRITGISGLKDGRFLTATGPASSVFTKTNKLGYDDGLGNNIIGTFLNCAGGTTPWGTVLSAEENYQSQVPEAVMIDGSSLAPGEQTFFIPFGGAASALGFAGNKYGWMVEVDPADPEDYGVKHTWLGRFRHEAVGIRAVPGEKLAVYSGCDRRGGHLYKFVSKGAVQDITDKANSRLLEEGMLYGAYFNPDGTGRWIPLAPDTAVNPVLPSQVVGQEGQGMVLLPHPDRHSGYLSFTNDADTLQFKRQFPTLGDLYQGNNLVEKQGAILIDAHYAANAAGVTATARPEDTQVDPRTGTLFIAFTSGSPGSDGGPDKEIFQGPNGEVPYEHGWIMKLLENEDNPDSMLFKWEMLAVGGEPTEGGLGFSNPDNLEIDAQGNLWMVTDISTGKQNLAAPERTASGEPLSQTDLQGIFGNNTAWFIPLTGPLAGNAYPFAIGPMECELCGIFPTEDLKTLFLAPQHPGENNGLRKERDLETRQFALKTTDGQDFSQARIVPIGSNWPGKGLSDPPKPSLVAVRRLDGGTIV